MSAGRSGRIVVGVDGSPASVAALQWASKMAPVFDATVDATVVNDLVSGSAAVYLDQPWDPALEARAVLDRTIELAFGGSPPDVLIRTTVVGQTTHALLGAAEGATMLVVGNRGHRALTGVLLGSVSEACVGRASCPVLVVHADNGAPVADAPAFAATADVR